MITVWPPYKYEYDNESQEELEAPVDGAHLTSLTSSMDLVVSLLGI
jgi:hypothetical protein